MARLYPSHIPSDAPSSEKVVLDALSKLPNAYSVFHGVNWLNLNPKANQRVGETDLIILHPKHGVLVIEVKGGRIKVEDGDWYSIDRYDKSHRLSRSPAVQARGNMYFLKEKIEKMRIVTAATFEQGLMGYAVWFPHIDKENVSLPMDIQPELVLDGQSIYQPEQDIEVAFGCWRKHKTAELDKMQLAKIRQLISPEVTMVPSLNLLLKQQDNELISLTNEQQQAFKMIQSNRKLLVSGGAGTGKTLLAIEDAKQQAQSGKKALFLCFNKLLAEHLKQSLAEQENIMIDSFHSFVETLCKQNHIAFQPPKGGTELKLFFHEKSPLLLMEAAEFLQDKYEAIVVDEAQDFLPDWWDALEMTLVENPVFHCFYDANQTIFQGDWEPPFAEPKFGPLNINCRNTSPIGLMARQLAKVEHEESYRSIDGVEPEILYYENNSNQRLLIKTLLQKWIDEGGVNPEKIVILSPYKRERSVMDVEKIGKWKVRSLGSDMSVHPMNITFSTIRAFKGLEADAIIIVDVDGGSWAMDRQSLYVAASRAKHLLAICASHEADVKLGAGK